MRERKEQEFHTVRHSELIEYLQKIILDGVPAQSELNPNFAIGKPLRQEG